MLRKFALLLVLVLSFVLVRPAYAAPGDCDGTPADDVVTCSSDPTNPDDVVGLGLGDDTYVQDAGVTSLIVDGDALEDGSTGVGNGGDDHITINGTVTLCVDGDNVDGNGGNDTIIVNGEVQCDLIGDYVDGDGGDDRLVVNGRVDSSVSGDTADGNGGNDTIIINGQVDGDVIGDDALGDGGDDTIIINGSVAGYVVADNIGGAGGNDRVELGEGADVGGDIYGEDGFDTLVFRFLAQSRLNGLDPAGNSLTYNGHTYTWFDFERLLGLLSESVQELQTRTLYAANGLLAIETAEGIRVIYKDRLVAFIPYGSLDSDAAQRYQAASSNGWYAQVSSQGHVAGRTDLESFQVQIFTPVGLPAGQFTFVN